MQQPLKFLTDLFNVALITLAQHAVRVLSALIGTQESVSWGNTPAVKRFMKGLFESRPIFPKNNYI